MNLAVAECRLPDLCLPPLPCFVNLVWSKRGKIPDLYEDVCDESIEQDIDTVMPMPALSFFGHSKVELFLVASISTALFPDVGFVAVFWGVTVNSTFLSRLSNMSFVFAMY